MKVVFTEEAAHFIKSVRDIGARNKIDYVIHRVEQGDRDSEIFKNLTVLTYGSSASYSLKSHIGCSPLGHDRRYIDSCHSRHYKKDPENTYQRD